MTRDAEGWDSEEVAGTSPRAAQPSTAVCPLSAIRVSEKLIAALVAVQIS